MSLALPPGVRDSTTRARRLSRKRPTMKLEEIEARMHLVGIEPESIVRIVAVEPAGADAVNVTYRLPSGQILEKSVFRADEAKLAVAAAESQFTFAASPADFKLAAEATRIKLAHLFDPMMAIHTSNVDPLPHQIAAVYESMLPKQPLRFVLADDPGAGKTIMAGLLIRELILRGDLERCLIVAPGSLVEQWQTELAEKFGLRFDILTHALVESTQTGNPFREHNFLIARLDQLARKEDWQEKLKSDGANWDLVIVDEAHKMAAHYFGTEMKATKRYNLAASESGSSRRGRRPTSLCSWRSGSGKTTSRTWARRRCGSTPAATSTSRGLRPRMCSPARSAMASNGVTGLATQPA